MASDGSKTSLRHRHQEQTMMPIGTVLRQIGPNTSCFCQDVRPSQADATRNGAGSFNRKDCLDKGLALVHDGTIRGVTARFCSGRSSSERPSCIEWLEADGRDVLKTLSPPEQWRLIGSAHHVCTPAGLARVKRI